MRLTKNKKGVALLMVLSAIVVLTTLAVEMAYSTNISYHLASNERERLKAYYLAKSGLNFMLLELKFDKVFRQIVQSQNLGQFLGGNAQLPLCQQFPMSTGLIRTVFTGGGLEALTGGGEAGAAEGEEAEVPEEIEEQRKDVSISQEKMAESFLEFEGDFEGECVDERTKINLNGFASLSTTPAAENESSALDQYKMFIFRFLSRPQYEDLFKESGFRITDVVNNIGDWVDVNTQIDSGGGRSGGVEQSLYDRLNAKYKVRNGKLLTLMEAYLIDGVVDDWFSPLMDQFTVYGDSKINVCTASEDILQGLIRRYVESTPSLPPLRLEDPEEMGRLTAAVTDVCASGASGDQLKQQVSAALSDAIGVVAGGGTQTPPAPATPGQPAAAGKAADTGFASYIDTNARFFTLNLAGQVKDTIVRVQTVIDVKEQDPKKWKYLYWRVY